MYYINADPHGSYEKIENFVRKFSLDENDTIILLGDVAINYFGDDRDLDRKYWLSDMPCTFFCIHGNHEMRPEKISSYKLVDYKGGKVWVDNYFPNLLFAKDGEIFDFDGKKCIVLGGAYSVDKPYRLSRGLHWFDDEQPSKQIKKFAEKKLEENKYKVNYVFSHTCPVNYEPIECFMPGLDQSTVDKTTEMWLDKIEQKLDYDMWYVGHYHIDKKIDKMCFLFDSFEMLKTKEIEYSFEER